MLDTWENGSASGERFAAEVAECLAQEHLRELEQSITELNDAKAAVLMALEFAPHSSGRLRRIPFSYKRCVCLHTHQRHSQAALLPPTRLGTFGRLGHPVSLKTPYAAGGFRVRCCTVQFGME